MAGRFKRKSGGEVFDPLKLHRAKNGEKVLDYLKREGVDPKTIDQNGDTPIHAYIRRTDSHSLECLFAFLINAEYEIDVLNKDADTPLHLACKVKKLDCVKALVAFDADINVFNRSSQTPLDIAKHGDCKDIAKLLEDVGGLTSRAIMDGYQEAEDLGFKPEMSKEVMNMDKDVMEMTVSYGGAAGPFGGRDRDRVDKDVAKVNGGGVNPDALTSKLQDVKESGSEDTDIGYQRQREDGDETVYFSPAEERQMDSIPEGSDEEYETPDTSVMGPITEHLSSGKKKPPVSQDDSDKIVKDMPFPIKNKSPSPIRYSPRSYSPTRPSSLLKSSQSPTRSPTRSKHPVGTFSPPKSPSSHSTHSKSPTTKIPVSRSPPPEMNIAQKSRSPHTTSKRPYSKTPPPELSKGPVSEKLQFGSRAKTPPNEHDKEMDRLKLDDMSEKYKLLMQKEDDEVTKEEDEEEEEEKSEAAGGEENFCERFTKSMLSCLSEVDYETRTKVENYLARNLGGEDYNEFQSCKGKGRKSRPPQEAIIDRIQPEEATDYLPLPKKETPRITTTSPPERDQLRSAIKPTQRPHGRRHTDGAVVNQPRHVHFPKPGESLRPMHLRSSVAAMGSSLTTSKSLFNPKMSVIKSDLGTSVMPGQMKTLKKGQRGHRILCLDGGGIKGLIELEILGAIERLSGCSIPELFDWIVGTSIGGIFTLGIVYGNQSVCDLQKMCFRMKDNVMKKKSWLKYSCDTKALESLLKELFGEKKLTEKRKPKVMVTAVRKGDTSLPLIFFNNCFNDEHTDYHIWKVARYTSAAPVFFKSCDGYVDGGMVANNPCNYGLTRIKMYLRETKEQQKKRGERMTICTDIACLISLGCGDFPPKAIGECDIDDALLDFTHIHKAPERIKNAVQTLLSCIGRSEEDAHICRIFCEEMQIPFYRFSPKVSEDIGTAETDCMKICDCIISAKKMLHKDEAHLEALVRHLGKEPLPQTKITTFV